MVSIRGQLTECGKQKQPHSERRFSYLPQMEPRPDPKAILRDNVMALMRHHYGEENLSRLAKDAKIGLGSAGRIKEAQTSIGLDVIESIASRFDLLPWQLLVPGLDPAHKPVLTHAGLSEAEWYKLVGAAETVAHYARSLQSSGTNPV